MMKSALEDLSELEPVTTEASRLVPAVEAEDEPDLGRRLSLSAS